MNSKQILEVELPEKFHLLVDEFQMVLYNEEQAFALLPVFRKAFSVTAFSGSPVQKYHINYLQHFLPGAIVMRFPDIYARNLIEKPANICSSIRL
jgi:hypothetical protein